MRLEEQDAFVLVSFGRPMPEIQYSLGVHPVVDLMHDEFVTAVAELTPSFHDVVFSLGTHEGSGALLLH